MDGWIRSLSDRGVFALVLVLGFGRPIYYSLSAALSGQPPAPIRIAYHLYQGSAGVVSIVPMGLAYAWLYARTGRLWPLVLAHVLLGAWALAAAP